MVHWWILGTGFPIDTGDHGGCWQWTFEEHRSDCEHVYVIRTGRVLSPDGAWPDRWLSEIIEINTKKLLEIEKEIVREVVRGDKHNLRKSANRNAQISVIHSAHCTDLCFADFLMQVVFVTSNNFTHNLLFYFQ